MSRIIPAGRRRPAAAPLPQRRISFSLRLKTNFPGLAVIRITSPGGRLHPGLQVLADVRRADRLQELQPAWTDSPDSPWVGLTHFIRFVNSYQFGQVIGNTLWIAVLGLLVAFPVPIILALLVNQLQSERFKKFTQTVLYSPAFISTVVVVGIMFVVLSPRSGLVNNAIQLGGGEPIFFMGSRGMVPAHLRRLGCLAERRVLDDCVSGGPGRQSIRRCTTRPRSTAPPSSQRIRHIDLPGIMPVITILFILAIGNLLNVGFEKALLMQTPPEPLDVGDHPDLRLPRGPAAGAVQLLGRHRPVQLPPQPGAAAVLQLGGAPGQPSDPVVMPRCL